MNFEDSGVFRGPAAARPVAINNPVIEYMFTISVQAYGRIVQDGKL